MLPAWVETRGGDRCDRGVSRIFPIFLACAFFFPSSTTVRAFKEGSMVTRGEEDATIVIDVGSSSAKAGFSGEDMPRAVCPSVAEDLHLSAEELSTYRARRPEVQQ